MSRKISLKIMNEKYCVNENLHSRSLPCAHSISTSSKVLLKSSRKQVNEPSFAENVSIRLSQYSPDFVNRIVLIQNLQNHRFR